MNMKLIKKLWVFGLLFILVAATSCGSDQATTGNKTGKAKKELSAAKTGPEVEKNLAGVRKRFANWTKRLDRELEAAKKEAKNVTGEVETEQAQRKVKVLQKMQAYVDQKLKALESANSENWKTLRSEAQKALKGMDAEYEKQLGEK